MSERARIGDKKTEPKRNNPVPKRQKSNSYPLVNSPTDQIMFIQRTIGNQAMQGLFNSGKIQAKLKIGRPGDIYEQEADRVAEQVMSMPETQVQRQRLEEDEEEIQTKSGNSVHLQRQKTQEAFIWAKQDGEETPHANNGVEVEIHSLKGGGHPFPASLRASFESRFGADFKDVRIHTDTRAARLARAVSARAFTVGHDIVFGQGEYAPTMSEGKHLLSHELAHVIQQRQADGWEMDRQQRISTPTNIRISSRYGLSLQRTVIPCQNSQIVRTAIQNARTLIGETLNQVTQHLIILNPNARCMPPVEYFYIHHFKVNRRNRSHMLNKIRQIRDNFQLLSQTSPRYRCVSQNHPGCPRTGLGHTAVTPIGRSNNPLISICLNFFSNNPGAQARTIVHELAHGVVAAGHAGGRFLSFGCDPTPVRSFSQAINNAYIYDLFAACVYNNRANHVYPPSCPGYQLLHPGSAVP